MWKIFDDGKSLGTKGSESGTIVLDYEDRNIGRITLENCGSHFAITYGIYGGIVNTIYGEQDELRKAIEGIKIESNFYKYLLNFNTQSEWCTNFVERYGNSLPVANDQEEGGFNDPRVFSLNHYLIDMFPELKENFLEYVGDDGYFYSAYSTYSDVLKPHILNNLENLNKDVLDRFSNLLEDISFSEDDYISNFFVIGLLEDIFFLEKHYKDRLLPFLRKNTLRIYKELEPEFKTFWHAVDEDIIFKRIVKGKCSICGGRLAYRHENSEGRTYCLKCGNIEIVTTHFNSIVEDDKEYIISILPNEKLDRKKISTISRLTGKNYIKSKDILVNGGEIFRGNAVNAKMFYLKLKINYIEFIITPDYPIDYLLQKEGW